MKSLPTTPPTGAPYAAFVSYSHRDMATARWLQHAIETFRVPRGLLPPDAPRARLRPIFRDENELPGAAELGPQLEDALRRAQALLVVCSPAAARSTWVDQEIRIFKQLHPAAPVLAVIAAGTPGGGEDECFPEALRWCVDQDGEIDRARPLEPLAPDLGKLGRREVKLKLVAGLLGIPYGALNDREQRRRRRATAALGSVSLAIIAALATLSIVAIGQRDEARAARLVALRERNHAIAARDLAERRTWLAQQAASQIRSFATAADCIETR